jgi:hypothetical protein
LIYHLQPTLRLPSAHKDTICNPPTHSAVAISIPKPNTYPAPVITDNPKIWLLIEPDPLDDDPFDTSGWMISSSGNLTKRELTPSGLDIVATPVAVAKQL